MVIYNITVLIDPKIKEEWLKWMQEVHIPDVMATGLFTQHYLCRVLLPDDGDDRFEKYAIQYWLPSMEDFETYTKEHAARLQKEHSTRYKDRYMAIRSVLETV